MTIEGKKGATTFTRDEHPFPDASMEKLAKLSPVFSKTGTITAGNSSGITDGAAAVVVASEHFVKQNDLKPLARIAAVDFGGRGSARRWESVRYRRCENWKKNTISAARLRADRVERSVRRRKCWHAIAS